MTGDPWLGASGGGVTVVARGRRAWIARGDLSIPDPYCAIPSAVIPDLPIRCIATNGRYVVLGSGERPIDPDDPREEYVHRGECAITVIDASSLGVAASVRLDDLGTNIGIVDHHVVDWHWYAQGDLLHVEPRIQLDGTAPSLQSDAFDDYGYCGEFAVNDEIAAGSVDYRGELRIGRPGERPRVVTVPERYRSPHSFARLGFDRSSRIHLTVRAQQSRRCWRLDDEGWTKVAEWRPIRALVEFAGVDGCSVRLNASQLPREDSNSDED